MPQQLALVKPPVPVLREGRMIGDPVVQIETAKPAVGEVQVHLFAVPPLRPDAETITNQQHPDRQLRVDRGTARVAVEVGKMGADAGQIDEAINRPEQVLLREVIFQRELIEQRCLRFLP